MKFGWGKNRDEIGKEKCARTFLVDKGRCLMGMERRESSLFIDLNAKNAFFRLELPLLFFSYLFFISLSLTHTPTHAQRCFIQLAYFRSRIIVIINSGCFHVSFDKKLQYSCLAFCSALLRRENVYKINFM